MRLQFCSLSSLVKQPQKEGINNLLNFVSERQINRYRKASGRTKSDSAVFMLNPECEFSEKLIVESKNPEHFRIRDFGGNNRARTYDPLLVRQMLSQLSYTPK